MLSIRWETSPNVLIGTGRRAGQRVGLVTPKSGNICRDDPRGVARVISIYAKGMAAPSLIIDCFTLGELKVDDWPGPVYEESAAATSTRTSPDSHASRVRSPSDRIRGDGGADAGHCLSGYLHPDAALILPSAISTPDRRCDAGLSMGLRRLIPMRIAAASASRRAVWEGRLHSTV